MKYNKYISYSRLNSYEDGRYYKEYILGIKLKSKYMDFGSYVHRELEKKETDDIMISSLKCLFPKYQQAEQKMYAELEKIKLFSIIDVFSEESKAFGDYKTGKNWTQSKADKSDQITFYCLVIFRNFGYIPKTRIHWLETSEDENGNVYLTGHAETFETTRTIKDILLMAGRIKKADKGIKQLIDEYNKKT